MIDHDLKNVETQKHAIGRKRSRDNKKGSKLCNGIWERPRWLPRMAKRESGRRGSRRGVAFNEFTTGFRFFFFSYFLRTGMFLFALFCYKNAKWQASCDVWAWYTCGLSIIYDSLTIFFFFFQYIKPGITQPPVDCESNSGTLPNQMVMASQTSFFLLLTKRKRNHYIPKLKLKLSTNNFYLKVLFTYISPCHCTEGEYILEFLANIDKIPDILHTFLVPKRRIRTFSR